MKTKFFHHIELPSMSVPKYFDHLAAHPALVIECLTVICCIISGGNCKCSDGNEALPEEEIVRPIANCKIEAFPCNRVTT